MTQNLPEAARAQLEAGEAAYKAVYGPAEPQQPVAATPAPVETPPAANTEPAAPAPAAPETPATPAADSGWETKFKVLQGKYNAEVPRLNQQAIALQAQVELLTGQLEEARKVQPPAAPAKSAAITEADRAAFGPELIDLATRIAAEQVAAATGKVQEQLEPLKQQTQATQASVQQVAYERFLGRVEAAVPDFREINSNESFHGWLHEHDPLLGSTRQQALATAEQQQDATRVAALFQAYKATLPQAAAKPAPEQQAAPLVTPRTGQTQSNQGQPAPRIYTRAEVAALFSQRRSMDPAKWAQVSAELDAAMVEGRVHQ